MGQWQVRGADRTSGHDVGQIYDASTRDDALTKAVDDGMLVEAVELLVDDGSPASDTIDELDRALRREAALTGASASRGTPVLNYGAPRYAGATSRYRGLTIAGHVLRVVAILFYVYTLAAIWVVLPGGNSNFQTLEQFLAGVFWPLAYAATGAALHGLGSACMALRDIARNSWR